MSITFIKPTIYDIYLTYEIIADDIKDVYQLLYDYKKHYCEIICCNENQSYQYYTLNDDCKTLFVACDFGDRVGYMFDLVHFKYEEENDNFKPISVNDVLSLSLTMDTFTNIITYFSKETCGEYGDCILTIDKKEDNKFILSLRSEKPK